MTTRFQVGTKVHFISPLTHYWTPTTVVPQPKDAEGDNTNRVWVLDPSNPIGHPFRVPAPFVAPLPDPTRDLLPDVVTPIDPVVQVVLHMPMLSDLPETLGEETAFPFTLDFVNATNGAKESVEVLVTLLIPGKIGSDWSAKVSTSWSLEYNKRSVQCTEECQNPRCYIDQIKSDAQVAGAFAHGLSTHLIAVVTEGERDVEAILKELHGLLEQGNRDAIKAMLTQFSLATLLGKITEVSKAAEDDPEDRAGEEWKGDQDEPQGRPDGGVNYHFPDGDDEE